MAAIKAPPKGATVPKEIIDKARIVQGAKNAPLYSKGRVSALGVFAELEAIEPILKKHRQNAQNQLSQALGEKLRTILPTLGVKSANEQQFQKTIAEIAQDTAAGSTLDLARIQSPQEILIVIADNLTESVTTHPDLENEITQADEEVFKKVIKPLEEVVQKNQKELEQVAVLGQIAKIATLEKPDQKLLEQIAENTQGVVETEAPLATPGTQEQIKASLKAYLADYGRTLIENLPEISEDSIPTLDQLSQAKEKAHNLATAKIGTALSQSELGRKIGTSIGYQRITGGLAASFGLISPTSIPAPKMPAGANFIFSNPKHISQAHLALLAFDQDKLSKALKEASQEITRLKSKSSLSFRERKELKAALQKYTLYTNAQAFKVKKSKTANALSTLFARAFGGRVQVASQKIWAVQFQQSFTYSPKILSSNEMLSAGATFGSLGFNFGGIKSLSLISTIRGQLKGGSMLGMGIAKASPVGMGAQIALGPAKRIAQIGGAILGGTLLYFLALGKAALIGALIGAGVGGTVGLVGGAAIGAAIGTAIFPGVGTVVGAIIGGTIGLFSGAIIGAIAGGLIGWGISTNSTAAASVGVGTGAGALIGTFIIPIPFVGTIVGALIGAGVGYLVGSYLIPATVGFYKSLVSGASFGVGAGAGLISSIGSFVTGLASAAWGGITSVATGAFGFLSSAVSSVVSLGSVSTASAAALPIIGGTVATVGSLATITGVVTAATFFSIAGEDTIDILPGQNEFFTLTKTANVQQVPNPPPDQQVTFTITLTAKDVALSGITLTDQMRVQGENTFDLTQDINGQPISPLNCPQTLAPNESCTATITINVTSQFEDSVISNTATATATPEGQGQQTESVTATVVVGNPPAQCPRGLPATAPISQGPEGATSHGPLGIEAIDIAVPLGTTVTSTLEGTVIFVDSSRGSLDQIIDIQPTSCAGLDVARFQHLSAVNVSQGDLVTFGQVIGASGDAGTGPHMHYQFNRVNQRNFRMEPPNIPINVPRTCDSIAECN